VLPSKKLFNSAQNHGSALSGEAITHIFPSIFSSENKCKGNHMKTHQSTFKSVSNFLLAIVTFYFLTSAALFAIGRDDPFKEIDANQNGSVSFDEWIKHNEALFTEIDEDEDGSISKSELQKFMKKRG
jgi:hypothetical protein